MSPTVTLLPPDWSAAEVAVAAVAERFSLAPRALLFFVLNRADCPERLVSFDGELLAAGGAFHQTVVAKPSDTLLGLIAAMGACDGQFDSVEAALRHVGPSLKKAGSI